MVLHYGRNKQITNGLLEYPSIAENLVWSPALADELPYFMCARTSIVTFMAVAYPLLLHPQKG
jgi:hypothetical protein